MIGPDSTADEILSALAWFFKNRGQSVDIWIHRILEQATAKFVVSDELAAVTGDTSYCITICVPPSELHLASHHSFEGNIRKAFNLIHHGLNSYCLDLFIKAQAPPEQRTVGLNNCFFKQEKTILHDELRFRSKGEVVIYDELKQRNVLFFPNPAAIFGTTGTEFGNRVEKREPDFLICFKGKWGILEINGDDFHSGIVKTTKDHERARQFNHYGVFFIQAYSLEQCKNDPVSIVDEFLKLLANHK